LQKLAAGTDKPRRQKLVEFPTWNGKPRKRQNRLGRSFSVCEESNSSGSARSATYLGHDRPEELRTSAADELAANAVAGIIVSLPKCNRNTALAE
jgi:hypothetical protein